MSVVYRHLANLYGCKENVLARIGDLEEAIDSILSDAFAGAEKYFHQFEPEGVTALYLGEDRHFTIHSWPETKMAAMDIVLPVANHNLYKELEKKLNPKEYYYVADREPLVNRRVGREVVGILDDLKHYKKINDEKKCLELMKEVAERAKFNVVGEVARSSEKMIDCGLILSESHFTIHYDRLMKQVLVDIFTCGREGDPVKGYKFLKEALGSYKVKRVDYPR